MSCQRPYRPEAGRRAAAAALACASIVPSARRSLCAVLAVSASLAVLPFRAAPAAAATTTISPAADTYVRSDRPSSSYGTSSRLYVAAGGATRRTFLRFAVPLAAGSTVTSASLRLRVCSSSGGAVVNLRSVADITWPESSVTWNNQPAIGSTVAQASAASKGAWVSLDARSIVQTGGQVSMAVTTPQSAEVCFASRDSASNQPYLVVEASDPVPTATPTATPIPSPTPSSDPIVTIAGDISGGDAGGNANVTANLVESINPTVALTTGDNAYTAGTLSEYMTYYDPTWGRFKSRTRPAPGNHEYDSTDAQGYYDYFDGVGQSNGPAGPRGKGYYSFNLGAWHLIALNPHIDTSTGSPQEQWLRADLVSNPGKCTLAYWHEPRFTSGSVHSNETGVASFWQDLYAARADLVFNGHNHQYERFAPQNPDGLADTANGIREFVVGTGGAGLYGFGTPGPNSEIRNGSTHGVLKLTLHQGSYEWSFVPVPGDIFTDSGSGSCHQSPAAPAPTPTPTPTGPYATRGVYDRQSNGGFDVIASKGFNLIDSTPSNVDDLTGSLKGLTWIGDYDNTRCSWDVSDSTLTSAVTAHKDDPRVGVWFISDEPDPLSCPNAYTQHKTRSDRIHSIDPDTPTLIVLDSNSGQQSLDQLPGWKGTADVLGLDPYPCYQGKSCDYAWIDTVAQKADAAGLPYWGVVQAFGDPPGGGQWRLPTADELHQELVHWRATHMRGYLVFAWRWPSGTSSLWLANHPELQQLLSVENAY